MTIIVVASLVFFGGTTDSVAPIFADHCVQCHHAGGMAPFSVETFEQARPWAKSIARAVANRDMPPFGADGPIGKYVDDPRLTDEEIAAVVAWAERPVRYEGIEAPLKPARITGEALWVSMDVDGGWLDTSKVNSVHNTLPAPVKVAAFYWPNTDPPIHHASIQRKEGGMRNVIPLSQYLPNGGVARAPEGYAVTLTPQDHLRAPIHVGPTEAASVLTTAIYIEEAPVDAKELPEPIILGIEHGGAIPPMSDHIAVIERAAEAGMVVHALTVHMHARGKSARLFVDGVEAFAVPRYDENWQRTYALVEPMQIRAGSQLRAELRWTNDGAEPVVFGPLSNEEMGWIELIWTPTS